MKSVIILLAFFSISAFADSFQEAAASLAGDLKASLMKNLSEHVKKNGPASAIEFCQINVKPIAKTAAGERLSKYEFGRSSHKIRNEMNQAQPWMNSYLKEFQGTFKGDVKKDHIIHKLSDGKRVYIEPLFIQAQCLQCHGDKLSSSVQAKLSNVYPQDKATGFKLNEFRGFIWVKEK